MIVFDPGVMEAAKAHGINFVPDAEHDGRIDQHDLDLAIAAKAKAGKLGATPASK